ncbi:MAG: lysophospholipid acyltransferase family protein [Verrucomicrobiaceae bacterium]|nr:lysophospholipid acyltransferase family protein [Verrucomicrobiaceae bacterium]
MPSLAKQLRYRLEWLAITLMAKIIPLLPNAIMLSMAKGLGNLAYLVDKRGRESALANVRSVIATGILPCSRPDDLVKKSYQFFARSMCELFWSARLTQEKYSHFIQVEIENQDAFNKAANEGAIWVTPHYGNFEWLGLMMGYRAAPFTLVTQDFKNPLLTSIFSKQRQLSGHKVISSRRAMIRLLKALKSGGHAAFLTDLNVQPDNTATPIRCFSFLTCVTGLHAFLHQRTGAKLIPSISIPCSDGTCLIKILSPIRIHSDCTPTDIAQRCWDAFEPHIKDFPEPWLWMYKHWRYRPEIDGHRYPNYANRSKKFDQLLEQARKEK